jgi:hypothetical protein
LNGKQIKSKIFIFFKRTLHMGPINNNKFHKNFHKYFSGGPDLLCLMTEAPLIVQWLRARIEGEPE